MSFLEREIEDHERHELSHHHGDKHTDQHCVKHEHDNSHYLANDRLPTDMAR